MLISRSQNTKQSISNLLESVTKEKKLFVITGESLKGYTGDIMQKYKFTESSLPSTFNSNPDIQIKGEDHCNVMESKSNTDSIDIELQLSNATVPLKKDSLIPNKKGGKAIQKSDCHDYSLAAKPTHKCPFETYLEKCTRLEKENLEVKKKLKKMEKYSTDCTTELRRFVRRFKEFKNINKNLDSKNKQLLSKNQQMRQRITEVLSRNRPLECLERITKSEQQEQLREAAVKKSLAENDLILMQLQQENQTLRESLDKKSQVIKDAVSEAKRVQTLLNELENCLLTVQTERDLLRQEVKRLHEEFISLTNSISLQLKRNNVFGKAPAQSRFTVHNSKVHQLSILKEEAQHNG